MQKHVKCEVKKQEIQMRALSQEQHRQFLSTLVQQKLEVDRMIMSRLKNERNKWRRNQLQQFTAYPILNKNRKVDLLRWSCEIRGPKDSPWEFGVYHVNMDFSWDFPLKPPRCRINPVPPHPNIFPSGHPYLSILNQDEDWRPSISILQILRAIYRLLKDEPNLNTPAQRQALIDYKHNRAAYLIKAKKFAEENMAKVKIDPSYQ